MRRLASSYRPLSWFVLAVLVAPPALLLPAGCTSGADEVDAGARDGTSAFDGLQLRFGEVASLQLAPLQNTALEVQALRDGVPVPGMFVSLALEGDAHDASIGVSTGSTDADGWLRTSLRGSSIPATFRVRATTTGAPALYLAVGVSATGFGNVAVTVDDRSATGPVRVRVEAYAGVVCAGPAVATGRFGRAITLLEGETGARFLGLPAETTYAVVARGFSASGDELAFGCVDGVSVASDLQRDVNVRLGARVQVIAGAYDAVFRVQAADLAALLDAARVATLGTQLPAGDASYLLDALETHLTTEGHTAALSALASARASGFDAAFAAHLDTEGAGPSVALSSAVSFVAAQSALSLYGSLTIATDGETAFVPQGLSLAGPSGSYSALPAAGAAVLQAVFSTELDLVSAVVMFDPVVITLPLGASVDSILRDAQLGAALGTWAALSGASSAAGFSTVEVDAVCDAACRGAVFAAAADASRVAWLDVLGSAADSLTITLTGSAVASDADADLQADSLDAELAGQAVSSALARPVVATLAATPSAEPPP